MRALFLLSTGSETADQYIAQESFKLLSIFGAAGGWIIAALILAAVFWKAGEERWKAYIPLYNWWTLFKISSWPGAFAFFGLVPVGLSLLGQLIGGGSGTHTWFALAVSLTSIGFYVLLGVAVYRIGQHLEHYGIGWLLLSVFLPGVALIIFAADKSIWRDDEELGWASGKIGAVVPPTRW